MQASPAEVARTLASGRLLGTVQVACRPGPYRVRHATDRAGRLLLLSRAGGELAEALAPQEVAVVLHVDDVPPVPGAPSLGQLHAAGWASVLTGTAAHQAALEFAEANPTSDLLDVGRGFVLYQVEPVEIRLTKGDAILDIDPDEYAQAEPDPLHAEERDLLVDLADHHAAEIGEFVHRQLVAAGHDPGEVQPRVVRMDRYGFAVVAGDCRARLSFPRAVKDRADLAQLLHPVLCLHCGPRSPLT